MTGGTTRATLDRIVDGEHAVLLLESEGSEVVDELVVDVLDLPSDARREGATLDIVVEDGELCDVNYRPAETRRRREEAQDRLDRLGSRLGESSREDE